MINDEIRFAQILKEVKASAILQGGVIESAEVKEAFSELKLSDEQLSMVYDYLKQNKIGLDGNKENSNVDEEDRNVLEEYYCEIENMPKLTDGELRAYTMSAMNGDEEAKNMLISFYLPQVVQLSKLYSSQGVLLEDLIGEGNLALAEGVNMLGALEEPEEAEGMLMKLIMDAMEELISEDFDEKEKDQKVLARVNEISEEAAKLAKEYGRKVTVEELSAETSISAKRIIEAVKLSGNNIEDIDYQDETV